MPFPATTRRQVWASRRPDASSPGMASTRRRREWHDASSRRPDASTPEIRRDAQNDMTGRREAQNGMTRRRDAQTRQRVVVWNGMRGRRDAQTCSTTSTTLVAVVSAVVSGCLGVTRRRLNGVMLFRETRHAISGDASCCLGVTCRHQTNRSPLSSERIMK